MSGVLKMPRMGETMEEGTLAAWLVEPGQPFKRGDAILEVETDKTVVEFPALGDGALIEALVELGQMVSVGTPIARIDMGDGPDWTADGSDDGSEAKKPKEDTETPPASAVAPRTIDNQATANAARVQEGPLRATPLARRLAKQNGVDIAGLQGSGRRGRIERSDIEAALTGSAGPNMADVQTGHGLAWLEKGTADGTPVLFVHGFAADHTVWAGLQTQMARTGLRTLAIDLPSHGAAALEALDTDDLHPPLQSLVQDRFSSKPVHIVAHSMGAIAAVRLAQSHRVASLTLIAPAGLGRTINAGFLEALAHPKSQNDLKKTLNRLTAGPNGLSEAAIEAIFQNLEKGRAVALAQALAGASGQAVDIRSELATLARDIPVSLVLGHRDQILDWTESLDVSPMISTHHFPDVGHMPQWEAPVELRALLERKIGR